MSDQRLVSDGGSERSVLIYGSCVSRDAFNHADGRGLRVADYYARSSVASAFGSAPVADSFSGRLASSFQRRQVQRDFRKTLRAQLPNLAHDLLLVDFVDERFPLFRFADGRLVTVSAELGRSGFPDTREGRMIAPFSDEHFALWQDGWSTFVAELRSAGGLDRLRLNAVWWSEALEGGGEFDPPWTTQAIRCANRHLSRLYERAARDLEAHQVLHLPEGAFQGSADHPWGPAPFHYTRTAYHVMLDELSPVAGGPT